MNNRFKRFLALHNQHSPFLLGNVWDVQSTKAYERLGYEAVGTSSAAVADTLGYLDGENIPFAEYFMIIQRIVKSTQLLVSVDLEAGYGQSAGEIAENIKLLAEIGIVGINIEDSKVIDGTRSLMNSDDFRDLLIDICQILKSKSIEMFINVRSDAFLLGLESPFRESRDRIEKYADTGVHGIFLPCITHEEDIRLATKASTLPVNVMCMPELPDFKSLQEMGVKRISSGNFLNRTVYSHMEERLRQIDQEGSFRPLFK